MASWMACPWVCDTVEMSTPMPRVTNRKSAEPRANTATEPRNGTSKSSMPAPTTITMSRAAMTMYGAILPTKTSRGRNGMTASCSMVPAWRSRTTPRAVATVPTKTRMMPHSPGIMMTAVRRSGLKRISALAVATEAPLGATPGCSEPPPPCAVIPCAFARARRAAWVANNSVPSRYSCTAAPARDGVTMAATASPRRSASRACAAPSAGRVATTRSSAGSAAATRGAPGPATSVGTSLTSKLAA